METDMRVRVDMSIEQAKVVVNALDLMSRLHMGQVNDIELFYRLLGIQQKKNIPQGDIKRLCADIKFHVFPELEPGSYHSISSDKISEDARVAWDLIQVLRHCIAWKEKPGGGNTVDFFAPMKTAKTDFAKAK